MRQGAVLRPSAQAPLDKLGTGRINVSSVVAEPFGKLRINVLKRPGAQGALRRSYSEGWGEARRGGMAGAGAGWRGRDGAD